MKLFLSNWWEGFNKYIKFNTIFFTIIILPTLILADGGAVMAEALAIGSVFTAGLAVMTMILWYAILCTSITAIIYAVSKRKEGEQNGENK